MSFARAVATVGGLTLASRVAGFARDVLTAAWLGAGPAADAFFVALKLPNMLRRLFADGAFNASFVPFYAATAEREGPEAVRAFAEEALAILVGVVVPLVIASVVAMPFLITVLAPGFAADPTRFGLAVGLARITFPYLAFIALVALLGGILNARGRFAAVAATPIAFNVVLILALLLGHAVGADIARTLAYGVVASGAVQLLWLAGVASAACVAPALPAPRLTPRVRRFIGLAAPGAVGAGIMQINVLVSMMLATLLPPGAVSFLYYADRLNQLPLGIVGIAIGTAILPMLSGAIGAGDAVAARSLTSRGLEAGLFLSLPAAAALIIAAHPIVAVLFGRGAFGPVETRATAEALAAFAIGIPAAVLSRVLSAAHFARHDTRGPLRIAAVVTVANAGLGLVLMQRLGHVGIALAAGGTPWLTLALLARGLERRGALDLDERLRRRAPRIGLAAVGLGLLLAAAMPALAPWFAAGAAARCGALVVLVGGGGAAYFALGHLLGAAPLGDLFGQLRRPAPAAPLA